MILKVRIFAVVALFSLFIGCAPTPGNEQQLRERILINDGWRFFKYATPYEADNLIYDERPSITEEHDGREADTKPVEAVEVEATRLVLKPWILPTGNDFIKDPARRHVRPEGNPGQDFPFVQGAFDDSAWEEVQLPHDWAIAGPFLTGQAAEGIGGSMGRLPSPGVAWYRRALDIPAGDEGKMIYLDIDGAMAYAMVWINGYLAGGWPYGYNSFRIDLTPYINFGGVNQLAVRLDNPPASSRWYPGGGIYRNVWITKNAPVHVAQWGTFITSREVSAESAIIDIAVTVDNNSDLPANISVTTDIYKLDLKGNRRGRVISSFEPSAATVAANEMVTLPGSLTLENPRLWGPPPTQVPNLYLAVTTLLQDGIAIDRYETRFGVRDLVFDPDRGLIVNGEHIFIKGVNQHHDLGALGAAFNVRAAERQLEILREFGTNAVRMAHNPPARELLELTDRMGFLVVNEIFDVWERRKVPLDFHLIFPDWYEKDTRAFIRRDRNHPSIIMWSFGNEVGEQYTDVEGAAVALRLHNIIKEEDTTRPTTASMNFAKPYMPFPAAMDLISLNYQGEGIRVGPAYTHLRGIRTVPLYTAFRDSFPNKVIVSSENAAALSSRGEYVFPVTHWDSAPVSDSVGTNPAARQVCSFELYTANFGSAVDLVFAAKAKHPFVAGGFVWSGFDYLGEPTPFYNARSTYYGVVDLAGFRKNRFYLYQSQWRPELPMAHILPHWNWPDRVGKVTPVHVFTSGDEAELFLNGRSLGRQKKGEFQYRFRWDDVVYEPGELKVVAYKDGRFWAEATTVTTGEPAKLKAKADRNRIVNDGLDLSFITINIKDANGLVVPVADNLINFTIEGPGEIVATDNGDAADFTSFHAHQRNAFNGYCLAIVRAIPGQAGRIVLRAESDGLVAAEVVIRSER